MYTEFYIDQSITQYFLKYLKECYAHDYVKDRKKSSLSKNCFATLNLLAFKQSKEFYKNVAYLLIRVQQILNQKLEYTYLHMVDYSDGGIMTKHKHDHAEDYSYILYLNSCDDGETVLECMDGSKQVRPVYNKVLLFSSNIPHKSNYSQTKKVLVGGLKIKEN